MVEWCPCNPDTLAEERRRMASMSKRLKILVRKSLKMSPGKVSAQCVHAALGVPYAHPLMSVVVLYVNNAPFEAAKAEHPKAYVVKDAGYTEVPPGTETCLAYLEDDPRSDIKSDE